MDEREKRVVVALAKMADQYLCRGDLLDSEAMDAGETALLILGEYGLVEVDDGGRITGRWTATGSKLLMDAWSEVLTRSVKQDTR
jgi:hypothetical protein